SSDLGMALREDSTALLPTIDVPVLVVAGIEDAVAPLAEAERMRDAIPDARLVEISGAGHLPNLEQPAAFDTALTHFLEANEYAPASAERLTAARCGGTPPRARRPRAPLYAP